MNQNRSVIFHVFGNPVPQGRGRIIKRGNFHSIKDPEKSKDWKLLVAAMAQRYALDPILKGPLYVDLTFGFTKPASERKGAIYRAKKPDIDNLVKAVLDGLDGVLYQGDQQIVRLSACKVYTDKPGVMITVMEVKL